MAGLGGGDAPPPVAHARPRRRRTRSCAKLTTNGRPDTILLCIAFRAFSASCITQSSRRRLRPPERRGGAPGRSAHWGKAGAHLVVLIVDERKAARLAAPRP